MPNKKKTESAFPEDQEVERRVDAMMEPESAHRTTNQTPKAAAAKPAPVADENGLPPIDIFQGLPALAAADELKTAPTVPAKLLKNIKTGELKPSSKPAVAPEPPATTDVESATTPEAAATSEAVTPPESTAETAPTPDPLPAADQTDEAGTTELDDTETDKAVDDIVAHESDELLAVEDAATAAAGGKPAKPDSSLKSKLKHLFKSKWTWIAIAVIVIAAFALPASRYKILGLVIKKPVSVVVIDSKTDTPVSSAEVSVDGRSAMTNAAGKATLSVPLGHRTLTVSKQYYKASSVAAFVGFKTDAPLHINLLATGRQVPITILNKITGKPVAGAEISVLNTTAKTNSSGQATIVLPASAASDAATITLSGYNTSKSSVIVTSAVVAANTFTLTPSGKVYFLSNASGTIDVDEANLDGSNRQTVLAGTGKEDPHNTVLLASRDWRYLVLEAQRNSSQPALYLIDTTDNDKLTEFDSTNANFTLVGWSGDDFIYDEVKTSISQATAGRELLKSYDAADGQLNQLDQNQVDGNSTDYAYQGFYNFELLPNLVVYNTQWYVNGTADLSSESDTIRGVQPSGQNKKDYLTLAADGVGSMRAALYQPQAVYYSVYDSSNNKTTYYNFTSGAVNPDSSLSPATFKQAYPTYLASPAGSQTFWSQLLDGQSTLFLGDQNAQNQKQVTSPGGFTAYGWYGNNYLLVSKSNGLYIMPVGGSQSPLKLTNYYQPS